MTTATPASALTVDDPNSTPAEIDAPRQLILCHISSWTPEFHTFYGDVGQILHKMGSVDMNLTERRMFLITIESAGRSVLTMYEHVADDTWATSGISTDSLGDYSAAVHQMIFDNQGEHCVGKSTQALVEDRFGELPIRGSAEITSGSGVDAFADAIAEFANEAYVKVDILLGC